MNFNIASFFSGAGGLDLGFHQAGFQIIWANEFDKKIIPTLKTQFSTTIIDSRSIAAVLPEDVPNAIGIIGGLPAKAGARLAPNEV